MDLTIVTKEENALLGRTEVSATLNYKGATPKRYDVLTMIAKKISVKPELIVIRCIAGSYGCQSATVTANVYKDRKQLENIEGAYMHKRNAKPEAKKEADAPAAPAEVPAAPTESPKEKAEAPAEAPKEEAPAKPAEDKPADKPAEEKPVPAEKPAEE